MAFFLCMQVSPNGTVQPVQASTSLQGAHLLASNLEHVTGDNISEASGADDHLALHRQLLLESTDASTEPDDGSADLDGVETAKRHGKINGFKAAFYGLRALAAYTWNRFHKHQEFVAETMTEDGVVRTQTGRGLLAQHISTSLCTKHLLCTEARMPAAVGPANMTLILTTVSGRTLWRQVHLELSRDKTVAHGSFSGSEEQPPVKNVAKGRGTPADSNASSKRRLFVLDSNALVWVTVCILVAAIGLFGLVLVQTRINNLSRMSVVPEDSRACDSRVCSSLVASLIRLDFKCSDPPDIQIYRPCDAQALIELQLASCCRQSIAASVALHAGAHLL
jgi:hypothetical protein